MIELTDDEYDYGAQERRSDDGDWASERWERKEDPILVTPPEDGSCPLLILTEDILIYLCSFNDYKCGGLVRSCNTYFRLFTKQNTLSMIMDHFISNDDSYYMKRLPYWLYTPISADLLDTDLSNKISSIDTTVASYFDEWCIAGGYMVDHLFGCGHSDIDLFVKGDGRLKLKKGVDLVGKKKPKNTIRIFDLSITMCGLYNNMPLMTPLFYACLKKNYIIVTLNHMREQIPCIRDVREFYGYREGKEEYHTHYKEISVYAHRLCKYAKRFPNRRFVYVDGRADKEFTSLSYY
jgi:hypothetical protein